MRDTLRGKLMLQFDLCFIVVVFSFYFSPDCIYHVCIEPCFDKKLEASRDDFYNEMYSTRDVDCVISTGNSH